MSAGTSKIDDVMQNLDKMISNYASFSDFDYNFHISEDFNFIFVSNPKAACSVLKASLNRTVAHALGRPLKYGSPSDIHNRAFNILRTPSEVGLERFHDMLSDTRVVKFAFVRDPVTRLASAYANKIASPSEIRAGLYARAGLPEDAELSFAQFVDLLASDPELLRLDEHWRPQIEQISFQEIAFSFLGRQERLNVDLAYVFQSLLNFSKFEIYDVRRRWADNASGSEGVLAAVTETVRQRAQDLYALDSFTMTV